MKALALLAAGLLLAVSPALAENYPTQAGNADRWNQAPSASTLQLPFNTNWSSMSYVGCPDGGPIVLPNQVLLNRAFWLESHDRATGQLQWIFQNSGDFTKSPTYDPDRNVIYETDEAGQTYCLSTTGQVLWSHIEAGVQSNNGGPLYVNNLLYAPTGGNGLICINPDTQAVVWRDKVTKGDILNSPTYDSGKIYETTWEGGLYCFDAGTGALVWEVDTDLTQHTTLLVQGAYFYRNTDAGMVECRKTSNAALIWHYQCSSWSTSDLSFDGGLLIVGNDDRSVRALDAATGQCIWYRYFTGNFARAAPIVVCGKVFITGCSGQFYGLDGQSGDVLWNFNYSGQNAFVDWATADGHLFCGDAEGNTYDFTSVLPGNPGNCSPLQAWTATTSPTTSPSSTATLTATPFLSSTSTLTATPSPTPTGTPSASSTDTPSASPSASLTATPTLTLSSSPTATQSATCSDTQTSTRSATPTPSFSATPSATQSATSTASPTALPKASPTGTPSPTAAPTMDCVPTISGVEVVPDPISLCRRSVPSVKIDLGPCGADSLKLCIYTVAMVEVQCWDNSCSSLEEGGWNTVSFPSGLCLQPGTYYLGVTAAKNEGSAHAAATFEVLP